MAAIRYYVVADDRGSRDPGDAVWTLSVDPQITGWNTDHGFPGYGLTREQADFLAAAANEKLAREGRLDKAPARET